MNGNGYPKEERPVARWQLQLPSLTGKLSLDGRGLRTLPAEIFDLSNLHYLSVHDNHLTSLPSDIGRLTELTILDLGQNELTSLPSEIGRLTKLRELQLGLNRLTSLPHEMASLENLEYLVSPYPRVVARSTSRRSVRLISAR